MEWPLHVQTSLMKDRETQRKEFDNKWWPQYVELQLPTSLVFQIRWSSYLPWFIHQFVTVLGLYQRWSTLKRQRFLLLLLFFFFLGGGVEMVIGWICSHDLFKTSWEGLHQLLPIVITEESIMFLCVLSLPQWRCYRNFEPLILHTNVHKIMASFSGVVLVEMILTPMHILRTSILSKCQSCLFIYHSHGKIHRLDFLSTVSDLNLLNMNKPPYVYSIAVWWCLWKTVGQEGKCCVINWAMNRAYTYS